MKKTVKKTVSVVAVIAVLCSAVLLPTAHAAGTFTDTLKRGLSPLKSAAYDVVESILTGGLSAVANAVPDRLDTAPATDEDEPFFAGTETFLDAPAEGAAWQLGYAYASLVPSDWREHTYYLGGFIVPENGFVNKVEGLIDDMAVRIIALADGSGRGVSLFATVDAIGVSNKDIRQIRAFLAQQAQAAGIQLCSVNVASTHAHSGVDTQGLWTNLIPKVVKNMFAAFSGAAELTPGADEHYLSFMRRTVADAMFEAIGSMVPGTMTFSQKDIGSAYFSNKNRKSASSLPTELNRFLFTPADSAVPPTVIVNMGAHPDVVGLPTSDGMSSGREISGDYVYYIGDELAAHGYNCMFMNGAIAGIYTARSAATDGVTLTKRYQQSERYGREIGKMLLAMNMTEDEIYASDLYDAEIVAAETAESEANGGRYTLWCENWQPVAQTDVAPVFNIRLREVRVTVTNPLILLAGKLKLANYNIVRDEAGHYGIDTEIGYAEFGDIHVALVPGELVTDLYTGGSSLTAAGSARGTDFGYPSLYEIFGDDVLCFGLTNDAIGYIVPDNDYRMVIFDDHYQELISLGQNTASTLMQAYAALADDLGL